MPKRTAIIRFACSGGFSLLELAACTALLLIAALAVGPALVGAQRNWDSAYDAVTSHLTRDSRAARITFQRVVRRASLENVTVGSDNHWIDLPYYGDPESTEVDRYARLTWAGGDLSLREGLIDEHGQRQMLIEVTVCSNASDCTFTQSGASLRMALTSTVGTTQMTTVTAASTNNK